MARTSVAHSGASSRELRGLAIFHRGGIERAGCDLFIVPGCSGAVSEYLVDLEAETCSCPDYARRRKACKHVYAATLYRAWLRASARRVAPVFADDELQAGEA